MRSLVLRMKDKPFALIGVNSDEDRSVVQKAVAKVGINWRSFFDGSTEGPISARWNIRGWPTIYVLDHKGVIRYKDVRGEQLDRAVDGLLEAVPSSK